MWQRWPNKRYSPYFWSKLAVTTPQASKKLGSLMFGESIGAAKADGFTSTEYNTTAIQEWSPIPFQPQLKKWCTKLRETTTNRRTRKIENRSGGADWVSQLTSIACNEKLTFSVHQSYFSHSTGTSGRNILPNIKVQKIKTGERAIFKQKTRQNSKSTARKTKTSLEPARAGLGRNRNSEKMIWTIWRMEETEYKNAKKQRVGLVWSFNFSGCSRQTS